LPEWNVTEKKQHRVVPVDWHYNEMKRVEEGDFEEAADE